MSLDLDLFVCCFLMIRQGFLGLGMSTTVEAPSWHYITTGDVNLDHIHVVSARFLSSFSFSYSGSESLSTACTKGEGN